jgi:hypothetical protein
MKRLADTELIRQIVGCLQQPGHEPPLSEAGAGAAIIYQTGQWTGAKEYPEIVK